MATKSTGVGRGNAAQPHSNLLRLKARRDGPHNGVTLAELHAAGVSKPEARRRTGLHFVTISRWEKDHGLTFRSATDEETRSRISSSEKRSYAEDTDEGRALRNGCFARAGRRRARLTQLAEKWAMGKVTDDALAKAAAGMTSEERATFAETGKRIRRAVIRAVDPKTVSPAAAQCGKWSVRVLKASGGIDQHVVRAETAEAAGARALRAHRGGQVISCAPV